MIIAAPRWFSDGVFHGPVALRMEAGRIAEILEPAVRADVTLTNGFLSPGMIDLHNNGAFGVDCATASTKEWGQYISGLAACGVTSVMPTFITAPLADLQGSAARLADAMPRHGAILGLHLEGPFLAPFRCGAHRRDWLLEPDAGQVDGVLSGALGQVLRLITLAPELPGAPAAITRLAAAGVVVALGHTDATATQMRAGVDAGARLVTHVFNAQSALHHRAPGAPGVALTDERLFPCLIADGVHVDPLLLKLAFAANERAIAVTDSIVLAGLEPGARRDFGGAEAVLERAVGVRADGTLAGAGITLDEGVRRLIAAGVAPRVALAAATNRPAAALELSARGRIAPGCRADVIWWGDDFTVRQVWTGNAASAPSRPVRGTEFARPEMADLEARPSLEIVELFLAQEAVAQRALGAVAAPLAALADAVAARMCAGGRLFYAGAGTSGRLALLDAVECGPTFGMEGMIIPLLAGGEQAFIRAAEGAEDDAAAALEVLAAHGFGAGDALVGIAASGATPFTLAALRQARAQGALTGAIVNNPASPMETVDFCLCIASGPEVIAGSTRLSAGSAQKTALNILSSLVMIRLGRTYGPYMVDMRASNQKLRGRALRMVMEITQAEREAADLALKACDMHVKTAALMLLRGLPAPLAAEVLDRARGSLRRALDLRRDEEDDQQACDHRPGGG